jgi:hypothetical protein
LIIGDRLGLALVLAFPILVVLASLLARRRWTGAWRTAATLPLIAIGGDVLFAYGSSWLDPTGHPFWRYELMVITAVSAVFLIAAASLRRESLKKQQ